MSFLNAEELYGGSAASQSGGGNLWPRDSDERSVASPPTADNRQPTTDNRMLATA